MLVRRVVNEGRRLTTKAREYRAREFFRVMKRHGIVVDAVQVKAVDHDLDIRTEIDAVGTDQAGLKVAIELKTSQHTMAEFSRAYYTQCRNQPVLTNQLPNCLYWRHQLQAAFAVLTTDCVRGVVAVMCCDGGLLYPVCSAALNRALFRGAATLSDKTHAPVLPYPVGSDEGLIEALSKRLKYTRVLKHEPTMVRGHFGDAVLLLVHKPNNYAKSRAAKGHRALARALAAKHSAACVIGWLDKGRWRFNTVVKRPSV